MPSFAFLLVSLTVLSALTGCFSLRAEVPEEVVRQHVAREEGIDLAAICSYEGENFSEGARVCMAKVQMTCDQSGRWIPGEGC